MLRTAVLSLAAGGLLALQPLALQTPGPQAQATWVQAAWAQDNDPVDIEHVSLDEAMGKLQRRGYSQLVDATTNRFHGRWKIQATNPDGQRVVVTVDNTNGAVLWEHPLR
jgi:polyisoprenoid-binding protein YceI